MKIRFLTYLIVISGIFALSSCNPTKYVGENEYLLDENTFIIEHDSSQVGKEGKITEEDLLSIVKQKPNRKLLLGVRFHLRLYSFSNEERIERRKLVKQRKADKKNAKIDAKNEKRLAKNEHARLKQNVSAKTTFGEGLRSSGEAPVILDSLKVFKTTNQIGNLLVNKGYFHNKVTDTIVYREKKKAEVIYSISTGVPFKIRNISYNIKDSVLSTHVDKIKDKSLVQKGHNFDTDKLADERVRITKYLHNNGYHFFNKEFIFFQIDSSAGDHQVDVVLGIQNYKEQDVYSNEVTEVPHKQYVITAIDMYPDYNKSYDEQTYHESIESNGVTIKNHKKLKVKPKLLFDALLIKQGDLYSKKLTEITYKRLSALGIYKAVSIQFEPIDTTENGLLVIIHLYATKNQSFNLAADGLHNDGLFGVEGSMTYSHRNLFGGAEKLQISFTGGLEAKKLLTETTSDDESNLDELGNDILSSTNFNTIEFGPKLSLLFPRFLFLNKYFSQSSNAKTELSTSYSFQKRPDFTRGVQEASFTWLWHERAPITYRFTPISISAIDIVKSDSLQQKIDDLNDRFLAASYDNSILAGGRISFEYNGQAVSKKRDNVFYTKVTLEGAGNLLRTIYKLSNQTPDPTNDSYSLFGTRFAQFVKFTLDTRYYRNVMKRSKIVYRIAGGLGIPLANLNEALPFQKSYYGGGANGMRAWKARTLGPGAYYDSTGAFDKIGDIHIEGNMEFRFPISGWIEGAWFVDAGNIWLLNKDSLRTDAEFDQSRFLDEIAFGSGLGIRLDLDFFVIRFDFAMPFKNPALPVGSRWLFSGGFKGQETIVYPDQTELLVDRRNFFKLQFNLGIGYPF